MMAALSQRTKNIRLGHGIVLTPPGYNHPARIAERIAALDLLSNGRVEFGTGESSSDMELGGFNVDRGMKKAMWEEATREITNMMVNEPYQGFDGEFFNVPARNVIPKPIQKPHPPLWVAASRRETTMVAARLGMASLGFGFETPEELAERTREYYRLIREECMPIGHAINPGLGVLSTFMCAPTDEEAVHRSANGPGFFSYSLGYYYNPATGGKHPPGGHNIYREFSNLPQEEKDGRATLQRARLLTQEEIAEKEPEDEVQRALFRAARSGSAIGSPDTIRKNIKQYEDNHLDVLILTAQAGDRKHEDIMESIELFGQEVLPEFKDRHETDHRKWREEQLHGIEFPINSSI
jgi:alkanesulfonate monooxygenase SsuD/methylene tetrahydromethanopterin reductase-like flavin-dependent oxidoreductase (luciferase family)